MCRGRGRSRGEEPVGLEPSGLALVRYELEAREQITRGRN